MRGGVSLLIRCYLQAAFKYLAAAAAVSYVYVQYVTTAAIDYDPLLATLLLRNRCTPHTPRFNRRPLAQQSSFVCDEQTRARA